MKWDNHIELICCKLGAGISTIRRIKVKLFVPPKSLQTICNAIVEPYFAYCSSLWHNCRKLLKQKLQKCQSRAARNYYRWTFWQKDSWRSQNLQLGSLRKKTSINLKSFSQLNGVLTGLLSLRKFWTLVYSQLWAVMCHPRDVYQPTTHDEKLADY